MIDQGTFLDPGTEYRGVTLWMLNDKLEPPEIARQLDGFHEAGWGALITRTFNGLRTPYLSDEWMDIIRLIIDRAEIHDLSVWLQAGYMPSAIPDLEPSMTHKVLVRKGADEPAEEGESLVYQENGHAYYSRLFPHVLDLLKPEAVIDYLRLAYEEPWWSRFQEAFGDTVETVWVDEPHFRPPLLPWNEELPQVYEERWGESLTDKVAALYAPVGNYQQVRHRYWRTVTDLFMSAYFAHISAWCAEHGVKFGGHAMGEDSIHAQIAWTGSAMRCYEHMQLPGIDHLTLSLRWPTGLKFILTPKQCSSVANQLGWEQVLAEMYAVSSQRISFEERKQVAEWLALLGINYRCYHGSFYSMRGVRKRIYPPHLSYQQPWWPDNRLIADHCARLSYALRQGTYHADCLIIHPIESGFCEFDPLYEAPVSPRIYGELRRRPYGSPPVQALTDDLEALSDNLLSIQRGFDYGDEHLLSIHGRATEAGLVLGEMTYPVVILPSMITIRQSTVDLLNDFLDEGGKVLAVGDLPTRVDGVKDPDLLTLTDRFYLVPNAPEALGEALDELVAPDIEVIGTDSADIWVQARDGDGERIIFFLNASNTEPLVNPTEAKHIAVTIKINGSGVLEEWDLTSGAVRQLPQRQEDGTIVTDLVFPPLGSHLLVLKEEEEPVEVAPENWALVETQALPATYGITRHDPNAMVLDLCQMQRGDGDWSETLPIIGIQEMLEAEKYDGPVSLRFQFESEVEPKEVKLAIEDAEEYGILVNGQAVSYAGEPYYVDRSLHPVDITGKIRLGENVIKLTRRFKPQDEAEFRLGGLFQTHTGVELEPIYLIGDFGVRGTISPRATRTRCVRFLPDMVLTAEPGGSLGHLSLEGYPFFTGRLSLSTDVALRAPEAEERVMLTLPNLDVPLAKVRLNGQEAGPILWPPYELEITPWVQGGHNTVEIELITSLRNLMGPLHRPDGELDDTWWFHYTARTVSGKDWYERREDPTVEWTDDYFVLQRGLEGRVKVTYWKKA
jgi:hypothetical protein